MLSQTKRNLTDLEIAQFLNRLDEVRRRLTDRKRMLRRSWIKYGPLSLVLNVTAIVTLLQGNSLLFFPSLIALLVLVYFSSKEAESERIEIRSSKLQESRLEGLVEMGKFVETTVTSPRCFRVFSCEEEHPSYFFDLGEQGTFSILLFENDLEWRPTDDFTATYFETPSGQSYEDNFRFGGQPLEPIEDITVDCYPENAPLHLRTILIPFDEVRDRVRAEELDSVMFQTRASQALTNPR